MAWTVLLIISLTFRELVATNCSDAAGKAGINTVLRMCESGNAVGKRIAVDTFDSAQYGVGSCQCDVSFLVNISTAINISLSSADILHSGDSGCNSSLEISTNSSSNQIHCDINSKQGHSLSIHLKYVLIWKSSAINSTSGYCLQLEMNTNNVSMNITCIPNDRRLNTESTASTVTKKDTETSALHTATSVSFERETIFTTEYHPTNGAVDISTKKEENILMTIIVPTAAAAGGFILILTVIVLIVMCKRKTKDITTKEKNDLKTGIRANTLYISADEVADIKQQDGLTNNSFLTDQETEHDTLQNTEKPNNMELLNIDQPQRALYANIDQPQGALYAVVNKKNQSASDKKEAPIAAPRKSQQGTSGRDSLQNPKHQNETNFRNTEQSQRALYAVANQKNESGSGKKDVPIAAPRKSQQGNSDHDSLQNPENKNEMTFQNTEQSQGALYAIVNKNISYKNQDGLNYTQVEVNADSSPTSVVPSVRISPKETESDRVTYSEVIIGD